MALHVFKQEGRSAGSVFVFCDARVRPDFANAIGNLGNFKFRRNLFADALELAVFFECLDPVAQIVVGQSRAPNGGYRSSTHSKAEWYGRNESSENRDQRTENRERGQGRPLWFCLAHQTMRCSP